MQIVLLALAGLFSIVAAYTLAATALRVYEQQQRPAWSRYALSRFVREWMAGVWMVLGAPLALLPHAPRPALGELSGRPPVILVPGYGLTRMMLLPLAAYLRRRGRWVWAINNPIHRDDIAAFAAHLGACVERLRRESGAEQVDVVGHSMGGVVAGWYINHLGGGAAVRRLVTLGTPWQGTRIHIFGVGRQCHALAPTSPTLEALQPVACDTWALWSRVDIIVLPAEHAAPHWAHCVELDGVGHLEMPMNTAVMRRVRDALDAPRPAAGGEA